MVVHNSYLDYMRGWFNKAMDATVTVVYYTTSACYGSVTRSGCTIATYNGSLWPASAREVMDPSKVTEFSGWKLALPHDAAISASNDVYINSTQYNVRFSDDSKSHKAMIVVDLERAK